MAKTKRHLIISGIILIIALMFGLGIGAITWIIQDTPDISNYRGATEATLVYGADGQLLTKLFRQNRIYVPLVRIPKDLQNALVAIEDTSFYVHHGIDFWGIARAVITNIVKNRARPHGASTITQQLAGNTLLNRQNVSYYRKIQEAYLAFQFERLYTKPEILEMYLNEVFMGDKYNNAYGVEAASQLYFGKHVWELNLSESALIAGLPKGSAIYSPLQNYDRSIQRRNAVLARMLELDYINKKEYEEALNHKIIVSTKQKEEKEELAPYFIRYVRDQLIDRFGAQIVYGGGLKVYTTLDPEMQKKAEKAVQDAIDQKYIPSVEKGDTTDKLQPQLALITLDAKTGAIRAMVGGRGNDQFNRAVQAVRQPGSAFKPFVYTTAIKKGYTPASIINDMPMLAKEEKDQPLRLWPKNTDDKYRGQVTFRTALEHSINVAAVKLIQQVSVDETIKMAEAMGITTFTPGDNNKAHLSLALGGLNKGVTPLEMAAAYNVFANQGIWIEPTVITKVLDKRDRVLYRAHPEKKIVLAEDVAYLMTSMLQSVITNGTGWRANLQRPTAGKTGTTNGYSDAWFVGYTPDLVTSVWIGEDNISPMEYNQKDENGNYLFLENGHGRIVSSEEATQLWGDYMRNVVKNMPVTYFPVPNNITTLEIDPLTGNLPGSYTEKTVKEVFRDDNIPVEVDNIHEPIITVKIDKETGQLATANCPEENIVEYNYFANSGIRVGPAEIKFSKIEEENEENKTIIKGTYFVDKGEPVQAIDPETGVPLRDNLENIVYEIKPEIECELHKPKVDNLIDSIWEFFKLNG